MKKQKIYNDRNLKERLKKDILKPVKML